MTSCKVCNETFENDKAFHAHLKKHNMYQAEYYCKYYPRFSLFYKTQIPFKNKTDYFATEFLDINEFLRWERSENQDIVKNKCLELVKNRIEEKQYQYAPFHNELKTLDLPPINIIKKHFGSYGSFCKSLGKEPLYNKNIPNDFDKIDLSNSKIMVDTREQDPLEFNNTRIEKLYVGDYLLEDKDYTYTFVDRKSEADFLGTLSSGYERFEREIEKTAALNACLFVVIETDIESIKSNQKRFNRKTNLQYVFHNMRHLSHKYPRIVQFVFTGSRENSLDIIPKILYHGNKLRQVDLQYFLDNELGSRIAKRTQELSYH